MDWTDILEASYGVKWGEGMYQANKSLWAKELKETANFGSKSGAEINDEICCALRYVADFVPMPRADPAQSAANYTCRDVRKWIIMYRASQKKSGEKKKITGVSEFAIRMKEHAAELISQNKHEEARKLAANPFSVLHRYPGQPTATPEELADVRRFVEDNT